VAIHCFHIATNNAYKNLINYCVGFDTVTAINVKFPVFWYMMLCSPCTSVQTFRTWWLHHEGGWRKQFPSVSTLIHNTTSCHIRIIKYYSRISKTISQFTNVQETDPPKLWTIFFKLNFISRLWSHHINHHKNSRVI
jgi:hypothetical protein